MYSVVVTKLLLYFSTLIIQPVLLCLSTPSSAVFLEGSFHYNSWKDQIISFLFVCPALCIHCLGCHLTSACLPSLIKSPVIHFCLFLFFSLGKMFSAVSFSMSLIASQVVSSPSSVRLSNWFFTCTEYSKCISSIQSCSKNSFCTFLAFSLSSAYIGI